MQLEKVARLDNTAACADADADAASSLSAVLSATLPQLTKWTHLTLRQDLYNGPPLWDASAAAAVLSSLQVLKALSLVSVEVPEESIQQLPVGLTKLVVFLDSDAKLALSTTSKLQQLTNLQHLALGSVQSTLQLNC